MTTKLPYCLLAAWLVGCCLDVNAQNDTTIHREIDRIDIIAPAERNNTSAVQLLRGERLALLPTIDVAGALRLFNGLTIKDYGGIGGLKTVSVRSLGASHTAVEYDGVPVSNTQAGQIDISRFDVNSISELKLSVGQDDNMLKPAKLFASGAVLSINSFQENFDGNHRLKITLRTGSFGYYFANCNYTQKLPNRLTIKTEGEYMRSDGMYNFTLKNYKTITTEKRRNTDIRSGKLELALHYNDTVRQSFDLKIYGYISERGLPGSIILYNPHAEERLKDENLFVQGNYKYRIFSNLTTKIIAKYNYSFSRYSDINVMYSDGKLVQKSTQNELFLSWINLWQICEPLTFSVAIDENINTLVSNITDRQPTRNTIQAAANLRYNYKKLFTATIGEVFTHLREHTEKGSHFQDLDRWSPFASVVVKINKKITATLMLKNTYRVPTFNELYYTTLGTTGLQPEDAREMDFGLSYSSKKWSASVNCYHNNVKNKIVAIPTLYIWKMANYGKVTITGVDLSADKKVAISDVLIDLSARYSYQKAQDVTDNKSKLYNSQIPYTPLHSGSGSVAIKYNDWAANVTAILSGKRYFLEYNIPDNEIENYAEFSASISRNFNIKDVDFSLKFSCINFTNCQYDVIKYYPMPGRQFQLNLSLTL